MVRCKTISDSILFYSNLYSILPFVFVLLFSLHYLLFLFFQFLRYGFGLLVELLEPHAYVRIDGYVLLLHSNGYAMERLLCFVLLFALDNDDATLVFIM